LFSSKVYIEALRKGKWSDSHIKALISFFSHLEFQCTSLMSINQIFPRFADEGGKKLWRRSFRRWRPMIHGRPYLHQVA
jgi:hypothetical protein